MYGRALPGKVRKTFHTDGNVEWQILFQVYAIKKNRLSPEFEFVNTEWCTLPVEGTPSRSDL
jgi:hypothetical protein